MTAEDVRNEQRRRVIDAAAALFADNGVDDVTMAGIAETAGVARATVFNYFGSKHSLLEAITETVLDLWVSMLDDALADETTPTPVLVRRLCDEMGLGIESQQRLFRDVFREIARIQLGLDGGEVAQRANEEARTRLVLLIERGRQRGDLDDRLTADALASAFQSLTNGTITNWLYQDPTGPLLERMRDAAEVFLSPVERVPAQRPAAKGAPR